MSQFNRAFAGLNNRKSGVKRNRRTNNELVVVTSPRSIFETLEFRRLMSLPAGWSDINIYNAAQGGTAIGSADYSNGVYTVSGSGFGYQFGFNYAYTTYTGDFDAKMRLTNLTNPNAERSAVGMMLRTGNNFNDSQAINGIWNNFTDNTFPLWMRMVRTGDTITAYRSVDGVNWDQAGAEHLYNLAQTVEVGIAVTGPSVSSTITATVDNFSINPLDLEYRTSWVGNTYGDQDAAIQYNFDTLALGPNGIVFSNTNWEEGGSAMGIYGDVGTNQGGKLGILQGCISGGYAVAYDPATNTAFGVRGDYGQIVAVPLNAQGLPDVYQSTSSSGGWATPYWGGAGGLAVRNGELYIADGTTVHVYNIATKTQVRTWSVASAGPIAFDSSGNVWMIQSDSKNPSGTEVYGSTANEGNYINCYSNTGTLFSSRTISMANMRPTALAFDAAHNRLVVADNGPDQQIKAFTNLGSTPTLDSTFFNNGRFGYQGGVFAGPNPGKVNDPAAGGDQRLYHPTGVVVDNNGNLLIGSSFAGGSLLKYSPTGTLIWRLHGETFVQTAAVDPGNNPASNTLDVYTGRNHYSVDLTQPIGKESTLVGYTWGSTYSASVIADGINRYGPGSSDSMIQYIAGQKFLFMSGGSVYKFNGDTAIPVAGIYGNDGSGHSAIWRDANADGIRQSSEFTTTGAYLFAPSTSVDSSGGIWQAEGTTIRHYIATGVNGSGVPTYVLDTANQTPPSILTGVGETSYDVATDTMYLCGSNNDYPPNQTKNRLLVRINNWSTGNRTPSYVIELPYDLTVGVTGGGFTFHLTSDYIDVAGDYIFVQTPFHPNAGSEVYVYDKLHGNLVTRLLPGPDVGGHIGNTDNGCKIHAYARANGEYLVFSEDDAYNKVLMYRWNPNETPTSVTTAAPTVLTNVVGSNIKLEWQVKAKSGVITGYNVYRSTAQNGAYTKLNGSPVTYNNYTDTSTVVGVTYYYKVAAVNTAGEGALSTVVSRNRINTGGQYLGQDNTTQGSWKGMYGSQGYLIIGDTTSMPSWGHVFIDGSAVWIDTQTTTATGDLQKANSTTERIKGGYGNSATQPLVVDVDLTDGLAHKVSLYVKSSHPNGTGDIFTVTDAVTGQVLDVQEYRSFSTTTGAYLSFNISGHTRINITTDAYQAEVQGVFIDPAASPSTTQIDDPFANLSRIDTSRSTNTWSINSNEYWKYNGDQSRATTSDGGTQYLTWAVPGASSFNATLVYNSANISNIASNVTLLASTDGTNWTNVAYNVSTPVTTADSLRLTTLSNSGSLPAGTQYLRLQVTGANNGNINLLRVYANKPANTAPTISTGAAVNISGNTATVSVGATDNGGGSNLTYSWATVGSSPASLTFANNGTNAASSTTAALSVNGTYTFLVNVYDSGNWVSSSQVNATYSGTVPAAPSGLTATAVSSSQINLAWTDNSSNETGFSIDRATNSGFTTGLVTTSVGAGVTSSNITGLSASTTYYFRVRATGSAGNSAYTSTASATTQAAIPTAPSALSATASSSSQINLAWTDNSSNETGFSIDRATNSTFTTGLVTTTVGAGVTSSNISGLTASTTYYFRVKATGSAGDSAYTSTASATTQASGSNVQLTGTVIGTTGSWGNDPTTTRDAAFDGNFNTFFDSPLDVGWVGLDLGTAKQVTQVKYAPCVDQAARMVGGKFQGSNTADFSSGVVDLYTITSTPVVGSFTTQTVTDTGTYRYVRYLSPANGYTNISELQFFGPSASAPAAPSGLTATAASSSQINLAWTDNSSNETGFSIDRATNSGFTTGLVTTSVGANVTTSNITGLSASTTYYFRVRATGSAGNSAYTSTASATTSSTSLGIFTTAQDIGTTGAAGSTSYNSGTSIYTIQGSGADMWNAPDAFHMASSSMTGDVTVSASVNSFTGASDPWAKAGVIVRESTATNSMFAMAYARPDGTVTFQWRATTGAQVQEQTASTAYGPTGFPKYVRVARVGNVFTGYYSTNGSTWTQIGTASATIAMASSTQAGLFVCSHTAGTIATATFGSVSVTGSTPTAPSGLGATAASSSQINLAWTDNSSNETGFAIDRATNSTFTAGLVTTTVGANVTSSNITGLTAGTTYYFRVRATNASGASANSATASATTLNAYGLFTTAQDVGTTGATGSTSYNSGTSTYTILGSGADMWNSTDAFHMATSTVSADATISASVNSFTGASEAWAKSGVIIRESNATNAMFAMAYARPDGTVTFQWRATTGGNVQQQTTDATYGPTGFPKYVRVTRVGNVFTGYYSTNGSTWTQIGTSTPTIAMASSTQAGLFVCSHTAGTIATATFTNVSLLD